MPTTPVGSSDGGGGDGAGYCTDFASDGAGGLLGLRAMIEHGNPGSLDAVSARWSAINEALVAAQTELQAHAAAALQHWEGDAADGFAGRAAQLSQSLGNGATYASNAGAGVSTAADALRLAKSTMPAVPSGWDRFTRALSSETNDHAFQQDLKSGMARDQAIKQDGAELSLMEERHQQAVAVMERLENSYNEAARMIGEAPNEAIDAHVVWPPSPKPTKHSRVTGSDGSAAASPRSAGGSQSVDDDGTGKVSSASGVDLRPPRPTKTPEGTVGDGVSGGEYKPVSPDFGVAIQGGLPRAGRTGGGTVGLDGDTTAMNPVSASNVGSSGNVAGESGIDGLASVEHADASARFGGAKEGASGRIDKPGGRSNRPGSENDGEIQDSVGRNWQAGPDEPGGPDGGGEYVETRPNDHVGGIAEEGAGQLSPPTVMGGFGAGSSQARRRKRRARAHYLLEDEESWVAEKQVNPPVIS